MLGTSTETKLDLDPIRDRLVIERDRLQQLLGAVTGSLSLSIGEDASSAKLRARKTEIIKAIGRIDAGSFGQCAGCGKTISQGRLEASPTVAHCLGCEMMGLAAN